MGRRARLSPVLQSTKGLFLAQAELAQVCTKQAKLTLQSRSLLTPNEQRSHSKDQGPGLTGSPSQEHTGSGH